MIAVSTPADPLLPIVLRHDQSSSSSGTVAAFHFGIDDPQL
jgi:hypothetical protein